MIDLRVHEVLAHIVSLAILDMTTSTAIGDIMPRVLSWIQCPQTDIENHSPLFHYIQRWNHKGQVNKKSQAYNHHFVK